MHSDLDQNVREEVLLDFRAGKIDVLVATDIVARGIDIDDIAMVVNYDVPREAEDYVHRIGRTARANADGKAVTLVSAKEQSKFGQIENFLGYEVRKETVPAELGEAPEYNPSRRQSSRGDRRNRKPSRSGGKGRKGNSSNNDKSNNNSISNSNKRNSRKNHQNHSRKKTSEGANGSNSSKNSSTPAQS